MSHKINHLGKRRLQRSVLAVPASSQKMIAKSITTDADHVFLDLEDSIAPCDKLQARANAIQALNQMDYGATGKTISVRINGLDSHYMYRDIIEVVEQAGQHIDTIIIPKVGVPEDIYAVEVLLNQIEEGCRFDHQIGIEILIESALGMANIEKIAAYDSRLEGIHFGPGDYAASCRGRTVNIGGLNPNYPGDQWHSALSRITVACRAYGLRAIDGAFDDFSDQKNYVASAKRAVSLGLEGKWAIHPSQISLANDVFSPTEDEVHYAQAIMDALKQSEDQGRGAASFQGRMIDAASERMAHHIVETHNWIESKK